MKRSPALSWALVACAPATVAPVAPAPEPLRASVTIDPLLHHVGDDVVNDWAEIASAAPEAGDYRIGFELPQVNGVASIELVQRGVQESWTVTVGSTIVGTLPRRRDERVAFFDIPAGTLRAGTNQLTVISDDPADDIVIGNVTIHPASARAVLDARYALGDVKVTVTRKGAEALPARLSIVDSDGNAVPLYATDEFAVRPGVAYTDGSGLTFALPAGDYTVAATRGMEWSRAQHHLHVDQGQEHEVTLSLEREVDTTGWIAADTHIHTLTYAHHGDALIDERMLSLAGEGVELAIATDHNHNVDYVGPQRLTGMSRWFTPVTGNEVSTPVGHFNAFPLDANGPLPGYESHDWPTLVTGMRDAGARYVILNHPHWPSVRSGSFANVGLDPQTGSRLEDVPLTFDALELINSTTLDADPMPLLRDWFALLNRGEALVAVGSSDSHTIGDPVGQGRTYVHSPDDDPSAIDVEAAIDAFTRGDVSVSLGIFSSLVVGDAQMGGHVDASGHNSTTDATVRVATPSWTTARRVLFIVNGQRAATVDLRAVDGPRDERVTRTLPLPGYDSWVAAVVLGDAVEHAGWATQAPYTIAVTNPVYVERDGRSGWSSPRDTARARVDAARGNLNRIGSAIKNADAVLGPLMHDVLRQQVDAMGDSTTANPGRSRAPAHRH